MRPLLYILVSWILSACIAPGPAAPAGAVLLITNYPIIYVDGAEITPVYRLELTPGEHSVTVVYHTYRWDYHCLFEWNAVVDQRYEINSSDNLYPVTLYRWARANSLWAVRYEPTHPLSCKKQPRQVREGEEL